MKFKRKVKLIVWILLPIFLLVYLYTCSTKMIIEYGINANNSNLAIVAYNSIDYVLSENTDMEQFISIERNGLGEINLITSNSFRINKLATDIARMCDMLFLEEINKGVDVPSGVFTGIKLLSGFGKKVNIKILAVNSVNVEIVSKFESAGINQTRHQLYAIIRPSVKIVTKYKTTTVVDEMKVILYDNLIIGKVPEVYLESAVLGQTNN